MTRRDRQPEYAGFILLQGISVFVQTRPGISGLTPRFHWQG